MVYQLEPQPAKHLHCDCILNPPQNMKNLFRILSILVALSVTTFVLGSDAKKDDCCDKGKACCCKDGSCDKCKAEKAAQAEKDAQKPVEKK